MRETAVAAAERIFAAAAELGTTRQEAVLVTRAVHAVKNGRPTEVALTDSGQRPRRKLAHVVGCVLWDPKLNADEVLAAVTSAARQAPAASPSKTALPPHSARRTPIPLTVAPDPVAVAAVG